jgi:2-phospho-L-lactate guanylyltransferase
MLWTLIPAKSFARSKGRLASLLSEAERAALSAALLSRTVQIASRAFPGHPVVVVATDHEVADAALSAGASRAITPRAQGLNPQLAEAAAQLPAGDDLLVLHADLPLLMTADLTTLAATPGPVVIAPDHRGEGTNALLLRAAHRFFAFGPGSCARHQAEAETRGLATVLLPRPGLARDLDDADDWAAVCAHLGHADLTAADLITHLATSH